MDVEIRKSSRKSVVFMLFLYMVINFADKAILGIVSTSLMQDLNLTASEYGFIASSFFFFFFISGIIFGFLSNHFTTKWIIAFLVFIWSITQLPIVWWPSFSVLLISRILLGIGEGPAYPVAIHALYKWFPDHQRNQVTMIIAQGGPIGIICAVPLLAWITEQYGWKSSFLCVSMMGIIWLFFWLNIGKEGPLDQDKLVAGSQSRTHNISYRKLILNRSVQGVAFLSFASYWILTMLITWVPSYLQLKFAMGLMDMSYMVVLIVLMMIPISFFGAYLSQYLLNKGYSTRLSRAVLVSLCVFLGGLFLFLAIFIEQNKILFLTCFALGFALPNLAFSLGPTIIAEIVPIQQRGALLAIVHAIATSAGVIAPLVTGWLIDNMSSPLSGYFYSFVCVASLLCITGLLGMSVIHPSRTKLKLEINSDKTLKI
ncbi:MFS transporter [Acinetobacter johnsonii]|uniref:MFS transporter n=1 Tax=Acinetobacter johnsonii TaxID=40214 RepID=UPI0021690989|nr:MFS transporter [Acinetobacter johnsonii]MCS3528231.1 MFS family permease [Acinetobacter johnsonii]